MEKITNQQVHIGRIKERILRNQKRIAELQELLKNEKIRELEVTQNLAENARWVNSTTENQKLLAKCRTKIAEYEFQLQGIKMEIKQRNSQKLDKNGNKIKAGQIIVEKVGELHLSEFLAIELGKMEEKLVVLLKKNESQNC